MVPRLLAEPPPGVLAARQRLVGLVLPRVEAEGDMGEVEILGQGDQVAVAASEAPGLAPRRDGIAGAVLVLASVVSGGPAWPEAMPPKMVNRILTSRLFPIWLGTSAA